MARRPSSESTPGTPRFAASNATRPGIKDVAARAGVSVGTVSNVLNDLPTVTPELSARVNSAIDELGYVRNAAAKTLRSGVAPAVGVIVLDITNPFFMEAARGMAERMSESGCFMLLSSAQASINREEELLHIFESHAVRGILFSPSGTRFDAAEDIVARGTPVVLFDSTAAPETMSSVSVDDATGAAIAIRHLLGLGHRRIAFLNGPSSTQQAQNRQSGVAAAIAEAPGGSATVTVHELAGFTITEGQRGMTEILDAGAPLPTAVFCANDLIATGASLTIHERGLSIPGDISIMGFDDIPLAAQLSIPLSTVRQPMFELGWRAADLLLNDTQEIVHQSFAPELRARESTAAPRER